MYDPNYSYVAFIPVLEFDYRRLCRGGWVVIVRSKTGKLKALRLQEFCLSTPLEKLITRLHIDDRLLDLIKDERITVYIQDPNVTRASLLNELQVTNILSKL
jgi:hypothetical protein